MNSLRTRILSRLANASLTLPLVLLLALSLAQTRSAEASRRGAGNSGACSNAADNAWRSCREEASSDHWLALGKCVDLSDAAQRKSCQEQADADLRDARQTCSEQKAARQDLCSDLGEDRYDPQIDPADFGGPIDNPYLPLVPGTTLVYEGQTEDGAEHEEFVVTHNTRTILGVPCVEVHDTVTLNGELKEDTLDWFAQDREGNVWYFGENSKELRNGLVVSLEGSWIAGVDGAKPGIVMEAHPQVGDVYRQEFSLGTAEDLGRVVSLDASATVPAGSFTHCLKTEDTTPLEPDALEQKFYAPGVGTVLEIDSETGERLELIQIEK